MHRLATVHARDNQPTNQPTNQQRRHDTAYLNKRLFYKRKVRRLKSDPESTSGIGSTSDHSQRVIFAHVYRVRSTSINMFVSFLAHTHE